MPRVLVIDDDPAIRANLKRVLWLEGYSVVEAADGEHGIERLDAFPPDLVLCDLVMPRGDGFSVLAALRAHPRLAALPFVMLTASTEDAEAAQCSALGADALLAKPFNVARLLELVQQLAPHER